MNCNLKNLCEKYNCDKLDHAYIEIYQKYFVNLRKNVELFIWKFEKKKKMFFFEKKKILQSGRIIL